MHKDLSEKMKYTHESKINYENDQLENWSNCPSDYLLQVTLTDAALPAQQESISMAVSEESST